MRFGSWSCVGLLALGVGCGAQDPTARNDAPGRQAAVTRLERELRVSSIGVLPGGEVAATLSQGYDDTLVVSADGISGWEMRNARSEARGGRPGDPIAVVDVAWHAGSLWTLTPDGVMSSDDLGRSWNAPLAGGVTTRYALFASSRALWSGDRNGDLEAIRGSGRLSGAGVVTAMLELPSGPLLVATFGKGVFRSADGGTSWEPATRGLDNLDVTSLVSLGQTRVLAGLFGAGVARSEDGGASWLPCSQGLEDLEIQALAYDGATTVLAGAQRGLFRSNDAGKTWKRTEGLLAHDNVQVLVFDAKGAALAGTWGNGMLRSTDRGLTWEGLSARGEDREFSALTILGDGTLLAGTRAGRVYGLAEDGSGWEQLGDRVGSLEILQIVRSPRGVTFAATSAGLYRFVPPGPKWTPVSLPTPDAPIGSIAMAQDGSLLLGPRSMKRDYMGLFASTDDGQSWVHKTDECLQSQIVTQLSTNPEGTVILAGCRCLSGDGGRTWSAQDVPQGDICVTDVGSTEAVALGSNNSSSVGVHVGTRGGALADGPSFDVEREPTCAAIVPGGEVFFVDPEAVWALGRGANSPEKRATGEFACHRLIAGSQGSLVMATKAGLERSTDGGRSWLRIDGLRPPEPAPPETDGGAAGGKP